MRLFLPHFLNSGGGGGSFVPVATYACWYAKPLAARKLAPVPRNSPAYVATIADAVADARRIVERIEYETRQT
jgi:hypothetical protein